MDWWMWVIFILVGTGVLVYLLWLIIPTIMMWYLRKKAIDYGINKAKKLGRRISEEVE